MITSGKRIHVLVFLGLALTVFSAAQKANGDALPAWDGIPLTASVLETDSALRAAGYRQTTGGKPSNSGSFYGKYQKASDDRSLPDSRVLLRGRNDEVDYLRLDAKYSTQIESEMAQLAKAAKAFEASAPGCPLSRYVATGPHGSRGECKLNLAWGSGTVRVSSDRQVIAVSNSLRKK